MYHPSTPLLQLCDPPSFKYRTPFKGGSHFGDCEKTEEKLRARIEWVDAELWCTKGFPTFVHITWEEKRSTKNWQERPQKLPTGLAVDARAQRGPPPFTRFPFSHLYVTFFFGATLFGWLYTLCNDIRFPAASRMMLFFHLRMSNFFSFFFFPERVVVRGRRVPKRRHSLLHLRRLSFQRNLVFIFDPEMKSLKGFFHKTRDRISPRRCRPPPSFPFYSAYPPFFFNITLSHLACRSLSSRPSILSHSFTPFFSLLLVFLYECFEINVENFLCTTFFQTKAVEKSHLQYSCIYSVMHRCSH